LFGLVKVVYRSLVIGKFSLTRIFSILTLSPMFLTLMSVKRSTSI
jgi:hypothetical protein